MCSPIDFKMCSAMSAFSNDLSIPTTLVSVTRSALRSRRRQYGAREVLERRDLLARELQHRTKNLLAVIQAIASASLQESHGREAFFSRLHALAKAQDLIIEGAGRGALMTNVVKNALESLADACSDGPEVFLNPNAAQGFALVMHELATNAAKHGSLSTELVQCRCAGRLTRVPLTLRSTSNGKNVVDRVSPPKRKGFGTVLSNERLRPLSRRPLTIPRKVSPMK